MSSSESRQFYSGALFSNIFNWPYLATAHSTISSQKDGIFKSPGSSKR